MMKEEPYWPDTEEPPPRQRNPRSSSLKRIAKLILWCTGGLVALPFVLTVLYGFVPPVSTLMVAHWLKGQPVTRQWTPIESISPHVIRAVVSSEDSRFCAHSGVDWREISSVLSASAGPSRGASTLTMQTAKNLFLWHDYPYVRKPLEIVLAHWIELVLPKRRILEIYLNIAEWGPSGTFGAEAGSQRAFKRSSSKLTRRQAALMAVALPNPRARNPAKPKAFHNTIANRLQQRMNATPMQCIRL